jgi:membrane complex biogenesis BtpA family protein
MSKFKQIFKDKSIIGAVHFLPMVGFKDYPGQEALLEAAKQDLLALQDGGVDAIIFENNYDLPHRIEVGAETVACMTYLITQLLPLMKVPFGVSVLWNDYKAAFSIAKSTGGQFIRIPVFVDDVKTDFGDIYAAALDVKKYQTEISAKDVLIFNDVQVKHATMHDQSKLLSTSINQSIQAGSDAVIVTGKWTGDAPQFDDLKLAREAADDFPILIGSGANAENISMILKYADGAIVSTSLKSGESHSQDLERNIKPFDARVDPKLVEDFIKQAKN